MYEFKRPTLEINRMELTVSRAEELIQGMMWQGVAALADNSEK